MKYLMLPMAATLCILFGCTPNHDHAADGGHDHDAAGNHIDAPETPLDPLAFTVYTENTELFVEFKPLIKGEESRFAAHFTSLGEEFKAIGEGQVTLSLIGAGDSQSVTANEPEVPGIFRLRMVPNQVGSADLVFRVVTPAYTDTITIEGIRVFADKTEALRDYSPAEGGGGEEITYLKEQAWKVEFANVPVQLQPFNEVIKTSGQILPAPGDEATLSAEISGIVSFASGNYLIGSEVRSGTTLFNVKANQVVQSDAGAALEQAENKLAAAEKNYQRAKELVVDKIISEREFLAAELQRENAKSDVAKASVSRNFNQNRQRVASPIRGFLKQVLVQEGEYVIAGQPLATVAQNKRLLLRVDVPQKHFSKIESFASANFIAPGGDDVYSTRKLGGKPVSFGKSAIAGSPFVPLYFEMDNVGTFIPGSVVEVFLLSDPHAALVIPTSALLENMGIFYAYVQTEGESFEKRELRLGASDGEMVEVISGVVAGERVVSKGGYQIKLSTASGTLPAHGHEH
jgi:cobalt-zinc-cadmium efflux system membrane fusion protein